MFENVPPVINRYGRAVLFRVSRRISKRAFPHIRFRPADLSIVDGVFMEVAKHGGGKKLDFFSSLAGR